MSKSFRSFVIAASALVVAAIVPLSGCVNKNAKAQRATPVVQPSVGLQQRFGDEIVVAGHFYRIGTPVVTWMDPGGYDAYRTERRFVPFEKADYESQVLPDLTRIAAATQRVATRPTLKVRPEDELPNPARYNLRYGGESVVYNRAVATRPALADPHSWDSPSTRPLTPDQLEQVRGGGWPLELLQQKVDQFVLHYDVCGTSALCFNVLQDDRGLSVQFMLDLDGTIYQTLDVKERAWQATKANSRSIGIEIANIGSYSTSESPAKLQQWYKKDASGLTYIEIPERLGGLKSQRTQPSVLRPARNDVIVGPIRGGKQRMYDLTPQQYEALIKLTAGLCDVLPLIKCDYPRDAEGKLLTRTLTTQEYNPYQGVLGHYHVQTEKSDPGPALQWEKLIDGARKELAARRAAPRASR